MCDAEIKKIEAMLPYQYDWAKEYLSMKQKRKLEKNRAEKQRVKDRLAQACQG